MKILLADDHPTFLDGLKTLLTVHGMTVVGTARNGLDTVDMARILNPDLILMDIRMPILDGLSATRRIKTEFPHVKVVVLTMSHDSKDLAEAMESGASGYLLKTDDIENLPRWLFQLMNK